MAIESRIALKDMLFTLLELKKRNEGYVVKGLEEKIIHITAIMDKEDIDAVLVKIDELKV